MRCFIVLGMWGDKYWLYRLIIKSRHGYDWAQTYGLRVKKRIGILQTFCTYGAITLISHNNLMFNRYTSEMFRRTAVYNWY